MILEGLAVGPIAANCYIIGENNSREGAIIDPGSEPERILEVVERTGLEIKFLIATHGHFDHTAAVKKLREKLDCDFLLHRDDLLFVQDSKKAALEWGFGIEQVPDPDIYIKEGDILKLGVFELKILHTPGHSPGGISIYIQSESVLFSGDTLFYGSIGRTDLRMGSMEALISSIKEKLYTLPDDTIVYTGHGEPTTIGNEKKSNFFVQG